MNRKWVRADTNWECFCTILHLLQIDCVLSRFVNFAIFLDNLLVWFLDCLTHKMFDRCLFTECLVEISQVNFSGKIGVCGVLFCISDCFSNMRPRLIDFNVLPGLLERIIGVILWWLLLFYSCLFRLRNLGLLHFSFQVGRLLLWRWKSLRIAVLNSSLAEFVSSYKIDEISFGKVTSWSSGLNLARKHAVVQKIKPSWGRNFYVLHLMVDSVSERSRRSGAGEIEYGPTN